MKKLRLSFNAPVTLTFIALCFIATLLGVVSGGALNSFFTTYSFHALNPLSWFRCFSHTIGHAGWQHFFSNMMYIIMLGPVLEERYGGSTLAFDILATGFATTMAITILFPTSGVIGASGVVFSFILLASFTSFKDGTIPVTFLLVFIVYIGQEAFNGVFRQDNISQLGHIVGGCVGSFIGYTLNKKKEGKLPKESE